MSQFLKTKLSDHLEVLVEAQDGPEPPPVDPKLLPRGERADNGNRPDRTPAESKLVDQAAKLNAGIEVAQCLAEKVEGELIEKRQSHLSEVTMQVALGFSLEGKVMLLGKAKGDASLTLNLKWKRDASPSNSTGGDSGAR